MIQYWDLTFSAIGSEIHTAICEKAQTYTLLKDRAAYCVIEDIRDYDKLSGMKKELNTMQIIIINQISVCGTCHFRTEMTCSSDPTGGLASRWGLYLGSMSFPLTFWQN